MHKNHKEKGKNNYAACVGFSHSLIIITGLKTQIPDL